VLITNSYFALRTFLYTRRCAKTQGQTYPDGKYCNMMNHIISLFLWTPWNTPQMKMNLFLVSVVNPQTPRPQKKLASEIMTRKIN